MEPIRYRLSFPQPHTHYVEVLAEVPTSGHDTVDVMMAVWTPGSYLVREFERHVESVTAHDPNGASLGVDKPAKNRWRIATGGARSITLHYRVYGREMSVRTNWIEAGFAFLNGAPTFLTLADGVPRPHEVSLIPAPHWSQSVTALNSSGSSRHEFCADDYDTLVDSPILLGTPSVHEFLVDDIPHRLVNDGDPSFFDGARAANDLEAIVRAHRQFWGSLPYDKYLFINLITEGGGGLEHRNCSVLMASRWAMRSRKAYLGWLELASHELFHVWNVKRLRPIELGPFDYEREVITPSLWVVEGITDYYGDVLVHRAGLSTPDEFLESLSDKIESVQTTPGRAVQSSTLASVDAWIKHYRPDENSPNTAMSYYTKGAVIAFLLDATIRRATGGARSLDDVMRRAYQRYSGARGYTQDQFRALAEEIAGTSLGAFWRSAVDGTEELDYTEALDVFGLRFKSPVRTEPARAWLGCATLNDAGRLVATQVKRHTPAFAGGLNVDDEILAIDDIRVRADRFDQRLEHYAPGDRVSLLIARRERLMQLEVTLGIEMTGAWRLERTS